MLEEIIIAGALLPEEIVAFLFAGMALLFITLLMVLLQRETRNQSKPHQNPGETLRSLKERQVDIIEIYDDVYVIPNPSAQRAQSAEPALVRRTAKVRDKSTGHVYLTRVTAPTDEAI